MLNPIVDGNFNINVNLGDSNLLFEIPHVIIQVEISECVTSPYHMVASIQAYRFKIQKLGENTRMQKNVSISCVGFSNPSHKSYLKRRSSYVNLGNPHYYIPVIV